MAFREELLSTYIEQSLNPITIVNVAWDAFLNPISDEIIKIVTSKDGQSTKEKKICLELFAQDSVDAL